MASTTLDGEGNQPRRVPFIKIEHRCQPRLLEDEVWMWETPNCTIEKLNNCWSTCGNSF